MEPLRTLPTFGETVEIFVDSERSQGACTVLIQTTRPGGGPPLHQHTNEDETFTVLEGDYELLIDGQCLPMPVGQVFFAPRGSIHTFRNKGTTQGRILGVATPAGLENFLAEVGGLNPEHDREKILAISQRYGMSYHKPPEA